MARILFIINAVVAWCALALSFTLNISGYYLDSIDPATPTILGNTAEGIATPLERFFDWITYFTIWSNALVAIVMTVLVFKPGLFTRPDRVGFIWRTLRLDSIIMIGVTGVIFNLLLSTEKSGWDAVSNFMVHILSPIVATLVWFIAGPRGLISVKIIPAMLVVPIAWLVFALVRGGVINAYPYPFLDVATKGMASVLQFVVAIVVVALVWSFILWAIDRLLSRLFVSPT